MSTAVHGDGKKRVKRGFLTVVTGRTFIVSALLLLQIVLLFWGFQKLGSYIHLGSSAVTVLMLIYILNTGSDPTVKLTWCCVIAIVPVVGIPLYFYIKNDIGHRRVQRILQRTIRETAPLFPKNNEVLEVLAREDEGTERLALYLRKRAGFPAYRGTSVRYFPSGEAKFEAMLEALEKAEKFIFLEYFIVSEGQMWGAVLEILRRKAKAGVEVRFMYDGTCAFSDLPYNYPKKLSEMGIQCRVFAPVRPFVSTHYNNRDHRKILVIDGVTAFTGGVNLADEYINRRPRFGHWKDAAIELSGEAARSFTLMFLQMWNSMSRRSGVSYEEYLLPVGKPHESAPGVVIPYGDSPMDDERVGEMVYLDLINTARRRVYIMSPYLILDGDTSTALRFAAKRGVDVRLILPHVPDKKYAFWLAKGHYRELTEAGVRLYEYTPGFIHSKVLLADGELAVVGTVNFDYRSFYHHFECAALLWRVPAIRDIEADFESTFEKCEAVTAETIRREKPHVRFFGALLKLVAPLM